MTPDILIATEKENDLLEMLLSTHNYNLVFADTGAEVLSYLREHTPALLMVDAHLPDLGGIKICSRVKKVPRLQEMPTILLVDARNNRLLQEAENCDSETLITKPLTGKDIRAIVARMLGRETLTEDLLDIRNSN